MLYWKLRDLIGCAIFASPDADFLEKIILTTPTVLFKNTCSDVQLDDRAGRVVFYA